MEPLAKKPRVEDDAAAVSESKVIEVQPLTEETTEADIIEVFRGFGQVSYVYITGRPPCAYVEFEEMDAARACMAYIRRADIRISGSYVTVTPSKVKSINRMGLESETPNRVLVLHIYNILYPIVADTIKEVCSPHGKVLRVVIIRRKTHISALVEFPSVEDAKNCKHSINGADIYRNCCTLKVEFAKTDNVRITQMDDDHKDYVTPMIPTATSSRKTLLDIAPNSEELNDYNSTSGAEEKNTVSAPYPPYGMP